MKITYAEEKDIAAIAAAEAACFPPAEAATEQEFVERIKYYGNHFWLLYDADKLIAFVDGFVTDEPDLTDAMYENACMHNENGAWQMIFGVNTLPEYRKRGHACELIRRAIRRCQTAGPQGTCADLQGAAHCVLRKIRLCRRRRVREIHARKCTVAPDAADVLRS